MRKKNQTSIFIVEDNEVYILALRANIESTFKNKHINIFSFETGEKCMLKFRDEKPQVVILDYHLNSKYPDAADGIEILDWIKKENQDTNVIMLTSDDKIDIAIKSFTHGASDYVVKTETQFMKINYSLQNLFKMIKSKSDAKRYKNVIGLFLCFIGLQVAVVIAILLIAS
jgi:two-component system, OmpR family, response regulator